MEIIIASLSLATLACIVILIGTRGKPVRFFTATRDVLETLKLNKGPLFSTFLIVVLVLFFLFYFYTPPAAQIGPAQPIAFSHRLHAGVKNIQCQFCHPYAGQSIHPGLPPVEKCLYCHNYIIAGHPEIQKEHDYYNTNTPTPWRKVYYLPEHVLFNHERHIRKDIACQACHGPVETMDRLQGERFKMGFCVECHQQNNANLGCWIACHS
ncbi:MAG: cytochrome c3 family protein [Desulfobacteraceae bacterium]|nr:cytochrome c3 family protein [Desulfobacteraceae bacterium]